ncbi:amidohydrolase family protein [Microlunatus parietis]|uniref:Imidazolonepropionase-like amidohydrolase n=1 Tax=Microlunatus parietis TaxID=682979 RepID=A0A7Y9ID22_9ACTN|nr:amidohydrolase family protein [Microlunatus parietis]NYE74688.1 imidazolonepropionase-like amidohydrolase [Microlunatus parietis]
MPDTTVLQHATLIDGTGAVPVDDATIVIMNGRIEAAGPAGSVAIPEGVTVRDLTGAHVIPGLMDANIHLVSARTPDTLLEYEGRYDQLAHEAAELALKYGLTTVFDTWGPAASLVAARDAINAGERIGSRFFCAGNIIGLDGPMSQDFFKTGLTFEPATIKRINDHWEYGCGTRLVQLTIDQIGEAIADYIDATGVDFIKYAASDHRTEGFLLFSEQAQRRIVEVCHEKGRLVQAHTTTVESLRMEVEAGADLLQHPDQTGETPIPEKLMAEIVEKQLPCMALMVTEDYLGWLDGARPDYGRSRRTAQQNQRAFIEQGARVLLTTDAFAYGQRVKNHAGFRPGILEDTVPDMPTQIGRGHFLWIKAAWELGLAPMEILRSATAYIAEAYGKEDHYGTVTPGKIADLVILDADPLAAPENYGRIREVIKDGVAVDRDALGADRLLADDPGEYRPR